MNVCYTPILFRLVYFRFHVQTNLKDALSAIDFVLFYRLCRDVKQQYLPIVTKPLTKSNPSLNSPPKAKSISTVNIAISNSNSNSNDLPLISKQFHPLKLPNLVQGEHIQALLHAILTMSNLSNVTARKVCPVLRVLMFRRIL